MTYSRELEWVLRLVATSHFLWLAFGGEWRWLAIPGMVLVFVISFMLRCPTCGQPMFVRHHFPGQRHCDGGVKGTKL